MGHIMQNDVLEVERQLHGFSGCHRYEVRASALCSIGLHTAYESIKSASGPSALAIMLLHLAGPFVTVAKGQRWHDQLSKITHHPSWHMQLDRHTC